MNASYQPLQIQHNNLQRKTIKNKRISQFLQTIFIRRLLLNVIIIMMNLFNNNQNCTLNQQNGNLNVMGNHNTIRITHSQVVVTVNGNSNNFIVQNSTIKFNINGNQNLIRASQSNLNYGFNGNQNQIQVDNQTNHRLHYCNGMGNRYPNITSNNTNNGNVNRQSQPRNMNNNIRRRQSQPMNRQPPQNNVFQFSYSEQQPQTRSRNNNFYTHYPPQTLPFNPFGTGMGGFFNTNFMEGFAQNVNNIFTNPVNRNRNFQFTNNRHNYNFFGQPEEVYGMQIIDNEQEQERGLSADELQMLPLTKHEGKDAKCTICLCEITIGENQTFLMCFHPFHWQCIGDWLRKSGKCPVCQYDVKKHLRGQE